MQHLVIDVDAAESGKRVPLCHKSWERGSNVSRPCVTVLNSIGVAGGHNISQMCFKAFSS